LLYLFDRRPVGNLSDACQMSSKRSCSERLEMKLNDIAFRTSFVLSRLLRPKVTGSMTMLENDTERRAGLGFTLNTYSMDLSEYVFNN
jgi:hypothetical protein